MTRGFVMGVSLLALGIMTGCKTSEPGLDLAAVRGVKIETSEQLLASEGDWVLVEDERAADPVNMHSSARKQVNPNNRAAHQYVPEAQVASAAGFHGEEDVNFRLIRMQRDMKGLKAGADATQLANLDVDTAAIMAASKGKVGEDSAYIARSSTTPDTIIPSRKPVIGYVLAQNNDAGADRAARIINDIAPAAGAEPSSERAILSSPGLSANFSSTVEGIRFGDYPDKTRMVLDLSDSAPFKADLQNGQIVLDLPKSGWTTQGHQALSSPLVKSYTASPLKDGGTRLSLELKGPVKLLGSSALPPNSQYGHRIYLDLAAS